MKLLADQPAIREKMLNLKINSYGELAKQTNVSRTHLSHVINQKSNPSLQFATKLSEVLHCKWRDIFFIKS